MTSPLTRWTWTMDSASNRADVAILRAIDAGQGSWESGGPISCSRSQLQRLIEEKHVTANDEPIKANSKIPEGAKIKIEFPAPKKMDVKPEEIPLEILYQDEHLVVINKPPGLTVHPSSTQNEGTLVHALLYHVKNLSGIGGVLRPGIVHRLDKDTSGALVVSKTDQAHRGLVDLFSRHDIERAYWAICYGSPKVTVGQPLKIETQIGRNPKDRKKMTSLKTGGRKAITYLSKLDTYSKNGATAPFASLLELRLETGRTHQIRVHLTGLGHSVLGDPVYGSITEKQPKWLALPPEIQEAVRQLAGQALHARVLGFKHPVTGEKLHFEAKPPEKFQNLLDALKKYSKI